MIGERFPITPEGFKRLEDELGRLKTVDRPAIIIAIAEARAHGDLSENAEYHSAKEKQGFIEAKIQDLEAKLSRAHIINVSDIESDMVQFGAHVTIIDEESEEEIVYRIVSDYEANMELKYISIASPVAKALVGKKVGDSVEVSTPKGFKYYEVVAVEFK